MPIAQAFAAAEHIAPDLREVKERFPEGKNRIRAPGGSYVPLGSTAKPVRLAAVTDGPLHWFEGTSPEAWRIIAGSVSSGGILMSTWVPPRSRPMPPPKRPEPRPFVSDGPNPFTDWARRNPVRTLVDVDAHGYFLASWRNERTASVKVYANESWHDYGPDQRHGVDSFDLWCSLNGFWDDATNKPERGKAARSLGLISVAGGGQ
jgi:hypothetical protein